MRNGRLLASILGTALAGGSLLLSAPELAAAEDAQGDNSTGTSGDVDQPSTSSAPQRASSPQFRDQLETIIVTATKRAELLSEIPLSVTALDSERLDVEGAKQIQDIAALTPGVTFTTDTANGSKTNITIRGIQSGTGAATTAVYIDDTPIQVSPGSGVGPTTAFPYLFDLDRVELLRGPQGTLFGASSEGGTVRFITTQPSLTTFSGRSIFEIAETQDGGPSYELGTAVGGPIVQDVLGFRVSAWTRTDGGYVDRVNDQTESVVQANSNWSRAMVLHAALTYQPLPELTISPALLYQNRYDNDLSAYWESISNPSQGNFENGQPNRQPSQDTFYLPSLKVEYTVGGLNFFSSTSYFQRLQSLTRDYSVYLPNLLAHEPVVPTLPSYTSYGAITNNQYNFTEEFRVQSSAETSFNWQTGAFYSRQHTYQSNFVNDPQGNALTTALFGATLAEAFGEGLVNGKYSALLYGPGDTEDTAVFGQAKYNITSQWKASAGVRVERTAVSFLTNSDGPYLGGPSVSSGSTTEHPVTPAASLSYEPSDKHLFYVSAAKGYRVGGTNSSVASALCGQDLAVLGLSAIPASFGSDSLWSYEIGAKDQWFEGRLQTAASAFVINWSNIQQQVELPSCGLDFVGNLGAARSQGGDLQLRALLTDQIILELAVGYTDAYYQGSVEGGIEGNGQRAIMVNKGDSLGVAPWSGTVAGTYNFTLGGYDSYARLAYNFSTSALATPVQDPVTTSYDPAIPAMASVSDVRLRVGMRVASWDVSLFMNNVLNAHPLLARSHDAVGDLPYRDLTLVPRMGGLTVLYKF